MQLDYMVLADYVRQDNGVVHIMGAGIDTIQTPVVPIAKQLGLALRISFDTTDPVGQEHRVRLSFIGPDHPVLMADAMFTTPPQPEGVPAHWRTGLGVAVQIPIPLPRYGDYSCEIVIDDGADIEPRSIDFRVIDLPRPAEG